MFSSAVNALPDYQRAGLFQRFVALMVDCILLSILGEVSAYPLKKIYGMENSGDILVKVLSGDVAQALMYLFWYLALVTVLWTAYFTIFTGRNGQTPGKQLLGIAVMRADGKPMDYKTAFNRFIGYNVSASVFGLGFIWALFNEERLTWHDKMAKTVVVKNIPSTTF